MYPLQFLSQKNALKSEDGVQNCRNLQTNSWTGLIIIHTDNMPISYIIHTDNSTHYLYIVKNKKNYNQYSNHVYYLHLFYLEIYIFVFPQFQRFNIYQNFETTYNTYYSALETLSDDIITAKSNIWSFGIIFMDVMGRGPVLYAGETHQLV